jgi:OmpA-OmpF porin, OOP family
MKRMWRAVAAMTGVVLMMSAAAVGQNDREGTKDYPGITRMPGYYIDKYEEKQFDAVAMSVTKNNKTQEEQVEGRVVKIWYYQKEGTQATSTIQIVRNYQNAAKANGGQVMWEDYGDSGGWRNTTVRFSKGGKELWVMVESRSDSHVLTVVEKQAMAQEVTIDAKALASDLKATGKVAIYGIYFDTGKSELKPESDAAVGEIAKMLKATPALKVFIVGHTDMVGDAASNVKLSQARAQSVVDQLVAKHAIPAARLVAFGAGPYAPVASNREEDGRAKNRRVELVEIATK